ncbi:MAG: twitch domain-containing radical SAM protein, partial [Methylophagaceae bacterium]
CNLKCSYCSPQVSSKWMEEIKEHGPYNTSNKFNDLQWLIQTDAMPIPNREPNPYIEAFWKWWPDVSKDLKHFRITGGEPLLTKDTFKILDDLIANPKPNLEFSVNSNMCVPDAVFNKFIEKMKIIGAEGKVKTLKIFTSAEAYGAQAEYIRHGLNYNQWLSNIRRVLEEVPNCTFTCMSTYNVLSIFSFDKMLKDLLDLKLEFGGAGNPIPIILDTPYLRYPKHQAMFIAQPEWRDKYVKPQLDFINNNLEDRYVRGKENMGFFKIERDKFQRLYDIINEEHLDEKTLTQRRKDFIIFVDEHDKRRGTHFLETFPEMESAYHEWKQLV